jgi:hypothetical protein
VLSRAGRARPWWGACNKYWPGHNQQNSTSDSSSAGGAVCSASVGQDSVGLQF